MRSFIGKLAVYFSIAILISAVIQFIADTRIRDKSVTGHDNINVIKNKDYDMVLLGSSRCYTQLDPAVFERSLHLSSINLGVDGHSELAIHYLRLKDYLAKNKAPRFVILTIDPLISAGSLDSNLNIYHKNSFARYAFLCRADNRDFVDYFKFNFAEKYIPLYALLRYKLLLDCLFSNSTDNRTLYGYEKHDEAWDTVSRPVNANWGFKYYFDTTSLNLAGIRLQLHAIDSLCQVNHALLLCVQTPIYKAMYSKEYFSITGRLCKASNIPFFDESCDSINNNISNFYNIDHMNTNGVTKMMNRLVSDSVFRSLLEKRKHT